MDLSEIDVLISFVDPGVSTGLVIFSYREKAIEPVKILYISTVDPEVAGRILTFSKPSRVVYEEMPKFRNLPFSVEKFYRDLSNNVYGHSASSIRPSEWKPFSEANKWKVQRPTPHERDVLNMSRWWFLIKLKVSIEDLRYENSYLWKRT